MSTINKETLEVYGEKFQLKAVKALLEEPNLLGEIYKILDQNCFTVYSPWLKTIVGIIKEYFKATGVAPCYDEIDSKCIGKFSNEDDLQYCRELIDKIKKSETNGVETIKEELKEFFKKKHRRAAIVEYEHDGVYDDKATKKLKKKLEDAECIGFDGSVITVMDEDNLVRAFSEDKEDVIPTFINGLDKCIAGGLGRGELGIFLAVTGRGKTTFGVYVTHLAAVNGYKAMHIFFEDKPEEILRKHVAMEMGVTPDRLKGYSYDKSLIMSNRFEENKNAASLKENLKLARMEDSVTTVDDIENKLKEIANIDGFRPDVLVIDYFSCLKHSGGYNAKSYEAEANTIRRLVALAFKYNLVLWVLQQANRGGAAADSKADMANWQGSWQATHPSSIFIELRRTNEQLENATADIVFHKTRHKGFTGRALEDIIFRNDIPFIDCSVSKETTLAFDENEKNPYDQPTD